jgi:hypothetical protein
MRKFIFAWFLPLLLLAASCQPQKEKRAFINGSFPDGAGVKLVLQEMDIKEIRSVDSVTAGIDGKFGFTLNQAEPGFWLLKAPSGKILVLVLRPGDTIELTGSFIDFPDNVVLRGPRDAMLMHEFFHYTRRHETAIDSLQLVLAGRQDSADFYTLTQKLDTSFRMIWEKQRMYEMAFIDTHPGSLATLIVINYAFGLSSVLDPDEDLAYFSKTDSALMKTYPDNKHVKFHHQRVKEMKRK